MSDTKLIAKTFLSTSQSTAPSEMEIDIPDGHEFVMAVPVTIDKQGLSSARWGWTLFFKPKG